MFKRIATVPVTLICVLTTVAAAAQAANGDAFPQRGFGASERYNSAVPWMSSPTNPRGFTSPSYPSELSLVPGSGCLPGDDVFRILPHPMPSDRWAPGRGDGYGDSVQPIPSVPAWRRDLAGEWQMRPGVDRDPSRNTPYGSPVLGTMGRDLFDSGTPSFLDEGRRERAPVRGLSGRDGELRTDDPWFDGERGLRERFNAPRNDGRDDRLRNDYDLLPPLGGTGRDTDGFDFDRDRTRDLPGLTPINYEYPLPAGPAVTPSSTNSGSPFYE